MTLIVSFDHPLEIATGPGQRGSGGQFRSFVAGLHTAPVITEHLGRQGGVGVGLSPLGARALLGMPIDELSATVVELSAVLGETGAILEDELAVAVGWAERFALLDRVLLARLHDADPLAPELVWAWQRLCASAGGIPIGELAARIGWSHRHLVARFRREIGLSPKAAASSCAECWALSCISAPPSPGAGCTPSCASAVDS